MRAWPLSLIVLAACGGGTPAPAPAPTRVVTPPSVFASDMDIRAAGGMITPDKVLQRISVIADDSMGGRNTPSVGLDKTAQYLADNYQRWGLQPLGDNGTYFQRYTLARVRPAGAASSLTINDGSGTYRVPLDVWSLVSGPMDGRTISGPVKVISGAVTVADIEPLNLTGRVIVFPQLAGRQENGQVARAIQQKNPLALIVMQNTDPVAFRAQVAAAMRDGNVRPVVVGMPATGVLTVTANDSIFAGYANRPNWDGLRTSTTPVILDAPPTVTVTIVARADTVSKPTAPNVVAMIEGADSVLKHEYVIFSGHMDHVGTAGDGVGGCTAKGADRICNGADDDASGTTGVLSVAEALARLKGKTRRSLIVLNVSGEEKGLLGSAWFAAHPTVSLDNVVADINMDMIGRNNPDSIVVIGKQHSDMGETLARVQGAHPELHLVAADDIWPQESFYSRSDHFNFARKGVPVLFFFNGTHPQYHQADDEVKLIDTSKLSRVAQLALYLGVEIANTEQKPKWNPESYRTIVVEQRIPK